MNELEKCPLCGKIPSDAGISGGDVWCVNNTCKLFEIHIPRKFWSTRPIENSLRKDLIAAKEEVDAVKNSYFATLREEIDATRNSSIETQKKNSILQNDLNILKKDIQILSTSYSDMINQRDTLQKSLEEYENFEKKANDTLKMKLDDMKKAHQYFIDSMQTRLNIAEEALNNVISCNTKLNAIRLEEYKIVINGLKNIKDEEKNK